MTTIQPAYLTPMQVAAMIGIVASVKDPERCVRRMARRGELVARLICGRLMISHSSLDAYLKLQEAGTPQ